MTTTPPPAPPTTTAATANTRSARHALRNFYNIGGSPLDSENFSPEAHVAALLSRSSVADLLRAENALVEEMRALDADRKALVYDNYSKLIAATETIRRMTTAAGPSTSTLEPAVAHIEGVARSVVVEGSEENEGVVEWALKAPERIQELRETGREDEARRVWSRLDEILTKWKGVDGVKELRERGKEVADGL